MNPIRTFLSRAAVVALFLTFAPWSSPCVAEDRMPGEATELTDEVRAKAQGFIDAMKDAKDPAEAVKARRGLIVLGPVVWPAVENAMRLVPPDTMKPHLGFLKALLLKKSEPEFEAFRLRLRVLVLTSRLDGIFTETTAFRAGRPDPAKPSVRIPPTCKSTLVGSANVYRSSDGSIVLGYGAEGTDKTPDAGDVTLIEATAGFVAAVGGKPKPAAHTSGRGGAIAVTAPMGFAFAWGVNGADGMKPGGNAGDGGTAEATGGAGQHSHSGSGGAGAPGK